MAGGGAGFFSGLLQSVGDGLQKRSKDKFEAAQADKAEFSKALTTAISTSDRPEALYPILFKLHGADINEMLGLKTDKNGDPTGNGPLVEVVKNLPHLFSGAHKALSGSGGKDASGSAPEGASGEAGAPPANEPASGGGQASQFPYVPGAQERETRKTDEEIRRYKETTGAKPEKRKTVSGPVGEALNEFLGKSGQTQEGADPELYSAGLRAAVEQVSANNLKKDADAKAKKPLSAGEKRGQAFAQEHGQKWDDLSDPEKQAYATLGAKANAKDTQVKQQNSGARLNAYLKMSSQSLLTNKEHYDEMQTLFPHVLAAKIAGEDIAALRPEVIRQQLAKGAKALDKPDLTAAKEAEKIVATATRLAESQSIKESAMGRALGWNDDKATIRKNLIQQLSAGQDPAAVEALAQAASKAQAKTGDTFDVGGFKVKVK